MAVEQYANFAQTTLNDTGGIDNSVTSFVVTDGSVFPTTGNFRIRIDDELMIVGARSGNTLSSVTRGAEGTTAASHNDASAVHGVLTKGAVEAHALRFNPFPRRGSPLEVASFSWVNQGSATAQDEEGVLTIIAPATTVNLRILQKSLPAAPYTLTTMMWFIGLGGTVAAGGLYLREAGTGELTGIALLENGTVEIQKWNSPTSFNANYTSFSDWRRYDKPIFLRLRDNNTDRFYEVSMDGHYWETIHQVGRTDFLTPDQMALVVNPEGTGRDRIASFFSLVQS